MPALPGVHDYIAAGYLTRGAETNPATYGDLVHFDESITPAMRTFLWEVETSGGLLLAVPVRNIEMFHCTCAELKQDCWQIGEVADGEGIEVL